VRSECGARGRSRKPFPGGSGSPPGRHNDRSPRSAVDCRQAEAGNARYARSQEARLLELSQRRMRSPWRVPRRSAERRAARDKSRCRARARFRWRHRMVWRGQWKVAPLRRSASLRGGQSLVVVHMTRARRASRERCRLSATAKRGRGTARSAVAGLACSERADTCPYRRAFARHLPRARGRKEERTNR
jgi:hypothetical protein